MYTKEQVRDHLAAKGVDGRVISQVFEMMVENECMKDRLNRLSASVGKWYENTLEEADNKGWP